MHGNRAIRSHDILNCLGRQNFIIQDDGRETGVQLLPDRKAVAAADGNVFRNSKSPAQQRAINAPGHFVIGEHRIKPQTVIPGSPHFFRRILRSEIGMENQCGIGWNPGRFKSAAPAVFDFPGKKMISRTGHQQNAFPFPSGQIMHGKHRGLNIVKGKNTVYAFRYIPPRIIQQNRAGQGPQQSPKFFFRKGSDQQSGRGIGFSCPGKHPEEFPIGTVRHPDNAFIAVSGQQTDQLQHQFRMKAGNASFHFPGDDLNRPGVKFFMLHRLASGTEGRQITQPGRGLENPAPRTFGNRGQLPQSPRYGHLTDSALSRDLVQRNVRFGITAFHSVDAPSVFFTKYHLSEKKQINFPVLTCFF